MKYALERLEELINDSYSPALYKGKSFSEHQLPEWSESITKEVKNVTTYLHRRACNINNERSFEILIHQYQIVIIDLMDKVYFYEEEADKLVLCLGYHIILERLKELYSFIIKTFSLYFNINERIPELYLQLTKKDMKEMLPEVQTRLKEKPINESIIKVSMGPLNTFIKSKSKEINYRNLLYLKGLCKQLDEFSKSSLNPRMDADKEMMELLVYMNVNSSEFTNYLFHTICTAINLLDEQALKIEKLTYYLKDFRQMQEKPGLALNIHLASVKEQVTIWINEEISYIETKNRLLGVLPALKNDPNISNSDKLLISVSVDVLALLARAGKDSKFILNKHMTEMFKNLAKFCRTVKVESPAVNSMLKKSYVAERSNKTIAIDILHEMIKHIHKY